MTALRLYWPEQAALNGTWKEPPFSACEADMVGSVRSEAQASNGFWRAVSAGSVEIAAGGSARHLSDRWRSCGRPRGRWS